MEQAMEREKPDHILHLGDGERDIVHLAQRYPALPLAYVRGNCDYGSDAPEQRVFTLQNFKFFLCHGHRYGVKYDLLRLRLAAMELGADICLFGHTHMPLCAQEGPLLLLNPGACSGRRPSYAILTLENGRASAEIKYL